VELFSLVAGAHAGWGGLDFGVLQEAPAARLSPPAAVERCWRCPHQVAAPLCFLDPEVVPTVWLIAKPFTHPSPTPNHRYCACFFFYSEKETHVALIHAGPPPSQLPPRLTCPSTRPPRGAPPSPRHSSGCPLPASLVNPEPPSRFVPTTGHKVSGTMALFLSQWFWCVP